MDWADAVNAAFEFFGGVLSWKNVAQLLKHKKIRGVYWPAWAFFAAWGWRNVFYYGPHLGQWMSWTAGLFIVTGNTVWLVLAVRYRKR